MSWPLHIPPHIEMTGKRFGKLTVISQNGRNKQGKRMWQCKCDCGNTSVVVGESLRANKTRSCGCGWNAKTLAMIGKTFGKITIIGLHSKQGGAWKVSCTCECGNSFVTTAEAIRRKHTQSCGCLQAQQCRVLGNARGQDLTGKRFGRLIVLSQLPSAPLSHWTWKCQCDCGNITEVKSWMLTGNHTMSCGCFHKDIVRLRMSQEDSKRMRRMESQQRWMRRRGELV